MTKRSWPCWAGMAVLLCARGAVADEPAATIVVTAKPVSEAEARAPTSFVSVIDTADRADEGQTVSDALAESVGVQVKRFGGLGSFSTISVRGSAANQVQIYLDGIPVSRARNETVNLADLPLDSRERIEVYRGTVPVGLGASGIGGVVNLVTRAPSVEPSTEVATSFGSFLTRKVVASHSQRLHGVDFLGHVAYLGSEGDFSFLDDNGTEIQTADDEITERKNNAFNSVGALLKGGYSITPSLRLDVTNETFYKDQGVPGVGSTQSRTASFRELRSLNYLRLAQTDLLDGRLDVAGTVFGAYQREQFEDRDEDLKMGPQDRDDETTFAGGHLNGAFYPVPSQGIGWFAEVSHERFSGFNAVPDDGGEPDQTRLRAAVALEDQASFFGDRLLVVPSIRYEHLRDRISERLPVGQAAGEPATVRRDLWSPAVGAQVRAFPWLIFKGNIGRFQRPPNFTELFGTRAAVSGDEKLGSETAINRDIGFGLSWKALAWLDRLDIEYAYFDNEVDDIIVLVAVNQSRFEPMNVGSARLRGHEIVLGATVLDRVRLDLNYTHQNAENRGADPNKRGNDLPLRPDDELYLRLETYGRRWKVYYELSFTGRNFTDESNFREVPSRDVHTVGASVTPREWLQLTFEAHNVTDNQVSDVGGFPLPGLSFFGTVRARF